MAKKRDKLEIIQDILLSVKEKDGKIRRTNIMYKSNLSFHSLQEYLEELVKKNFIREIKGSRGVKTFEITDRGLNFLQKYNEIRDFVNSFGV